MNNTASGSDRLWFEYLSRKKTPILRLFCFPYAGGSADIYRQWQRQFPAEINICLVHLPGRGKRMAERSLTRISALVNTIADRMGPEIRVPYALYGHSMGALVSFELSWELGFDGEAVVTGEVHQQRIEFGGRQAHLLHVVIEDLQWPAVKGGGKLGQQDGGKLDQRKVGRTGS